MVTFIGIAIICIPVEGKHSFSGRVRGVMFWAIFVAVWSGAVMLMRHGLNYLGAQPLMSLDLTSFGKSAGAVIHFGVVIVLALIPSFIFDGCYYWFHRLQHRVPLLWRFHAVHHSIEELNASNCYHHWTEGIVRLPFIYLPLALLIELNVPEVAVIALLNNAWGQMVHADASATFGPIGKIFVSPHYHRVHHSLDERHMHLNFAGVYPIFDIIFGTAYFPKSDEPIKTGLSEKPEPQSLRDYLSAS